MRHRPGRAPRRGADPREAQAAVAATRGRGARWGDQDGDRRVLVERLSPTPAQPVREEAPRRRYAKPASGNTEGGNPMGDERRQRPPSREGAGRDNPRPFRASEGARPAHLARVSAIGARLSLSAGRGPAARSGRTGLPRGAASMIGTRAAGGRTTAGVRGRITVSRASPPVVARMRARVSGAGPARRGRISVIGRRGEGPAAVDATGEASRAVRPVAAPAPAVASPGDSRAASNPAAASRGAAGPAAASPAARSPARLGAAGVPPAPGARS